LWWRTHFRIRWHCRCSRGRQTWIQCSRSFWG
jgi:hypothetical protein